MRDWGILEKAILERMEREHIPGVAVAISKNHEVVYAKGFGQANLETGEQVTPETIFGTASITKSFIALIVIQLEKAGRLSREDAVTKHLPTFTLQEYDGIHAIKIHHLLSHTTGIPTLQRKEMLTTFEEHLEYLASLEIKPLGKPGDYFCYNNDLFLLLGAIIEKVTGENYKEVIRREIIVPQQMTRTTFHLEDLEKFRNVTVPYQFENGHYKKCDWSELGNYAVGGGIRSTVLDLLKYGELYFKGENDMVVPVHRTHGRRSYGYGLHITPHYDDVTLVEHGGSQPGVSSNFGFIPEEDIVVAVLTNASKVSASDLWLYAVNAARGRRLHYKRSIEPHYTIDKKKWSKFVGTYVTGEGSTIQIEIANDHLQAVIDGDVQKLRASNEETLVLLSKEEPIRFYFNEQNEAWSLFIGLRMFVKEEGIV